MALQEGLIRVQLVVGRGAKIVRLHIAIPPTDPNELMAVVEAKRRGARSGPDSALLLENW